jgi:hypothetical protein
MNARVRGNECRLLVCAPSNQAVSVLASRFLATFKESTHSACRVMLVGDPDKLMLEEKTRLDIGETSLHAANERLRSVFLHSWITTIAEGYDRIHAHLTLGSNQTLTQVRDLAYRLKEELQASSIPLTKVVAKWAVGVYGDMGKKNGVKAARKAELLAERLRRLPFELVKTSVRQSRTNRANARCQCSWLGSPGFSFCGRPMLFFAHCPWQGALI